MSNQKNYKCIKKIKNKDLQCTEKDCRHWISSRENLNCSIVAAEEGPQTLQKIGDHFGISRMRVCQIEKALLEKLKNSKVLSEFDPSS